MFMTDKETAVRKGYIQPKDDIELKIFGTLVLSFFLPFIGSMIVFTLAVKNSFKRTIYFTEKDKVTLLEPIGFSWMRENVMIVPATKAELRHIRLKATLYYIFSVGSFVLHVIIWQTR